LEALFVTGALSLFPSEQIQKSLSAVACAVEGKNLSGWLMLTDQRLVFIRTGFFDHKNYAEKENFEKGLEQEGSFSIPLTDIVEAKAVSRAGPDTLEVYYQTPYGMKANSFMRMRAKWEDWAESINQARTKAKPPIPEEGPAEWIPKEKVPPIERMLPKEVPTEVERPEIRREVPRESLSVRDLRGRIEDFLRQTFGTYEVDTEDRYAIRFGTTKVVIGAHEWFENKTLVNVVAIVAIDVDVTKDLMEFLNNTNANLVFGKFFAMKDQRLVLCQHVLLGDKLDREELELTVAAVAAIADQYDEKIVDRFGGMRYTDFESRR